MGVTVRELIRVPSDIVESHGDRRSPELRFLDGGTVKTVSPDLLCGDPVTSCLG